MIAIEGNLRTRTYDDKNGSKHYITEVYVDSVSFTGEPKSKDVVPFNPSPEAALDEFEEVLSNDGVPF